MIKRTLIDFIETIVVSLAVIFLIYGYVAMPELVDGSSMEPNFSTGERILVDRITPKFRDIETGEVVVIHPPENSKISYIKRVVAKGGDIIKIQGCKLNISKGESKYILEESYLAPDTCTMGGPYVNDGKSFRLKENEYMVLGDNRENSLDSRYFGFIQKENIVGRVIFRFWPIAKAGYIK